MFMSALSVQTRNYWTNRKLYDKSTSCGVLIGPQTPLHVGCFNLDELIEAHFPVSSYFRTATYLRSSTGSETRRNINKSSELNH